MAKKRKNKVSCRWVPIVPGTNESSQMFVDLAGLFGNRPLTNYIYAAYLQPGVAAQMDNAGFRRNRQGQHLAKDVYKFFEGNKIKADLLRNTKDVSKAMGFMDSSGNFINFSGEDAYRKAQQFNNTSNSRVAYVIPSGSSGDTFNVLLDDKTSRTQYKEVEVNEDLVKWDTLKSELVARGIDVDALSSSVAHIFNPGSVGKFLQDIGMLSSIANDALSVNDIKTLFLLNPTNPVINNIFTRGWGDFDATVQRVYDILQNPTAATAGNVTLVNNAIAEAKKLKGLNRSDIISAVNDASKSFQRTDEGYNIYKTIADLNKKYKIDNDTIVVMGNKISKLSEAIADAAMSLYRQIRNIEREKGKTPQSENLTTIMNTLLDELNTKRSVGGLLSFLNTAVNYLQVSENNMNNISHGGNDLEFAHNIADAVSQARRINDSYYNIVAALANDESAVRDISISDTERQQLSDLAKSLLINFNKNKTKIQALEKEAMRAIGTEFIGESNITYGKDLVDIISMSEADASLTNYLYSIGRASNTVISMAGAIVRDAQTARDSKYLKIATEIARITDSLTKSGLDSSFMYDDKGRIVSKYDWDTYYKEKAKYSGSLTRSGFEKGSPEYNAEMQLWEDQNTQDVEVDPISHRTEKVPIYELGEDFRNGWTAVQNEYYDRMMALKGQIGTLLPNYAQHQFIAPQKRTTWDQVVKEGLRGERSFSNVVSLLLDKLKFWKERSDDSRFAKNGIFIEGEDTIASTSDFDNTVLRQIPIFYVNKIDSNDLSHDFSSALQALASSALNYEAMNNIRHTVELMRDYVVDNAPADRDAEGNVKVDSVTGAGINVARVLQEAASASKVAAILDGFVLKHIYGVQNKSEGKWATIMGNLIGYTSFKGLAVNVKGALTNRFVGVLQTIIEAGAGQYYNLGDLLRAEAIIMGQNGGTTVGALAGGVIGGFPGAAIGAGVGIAVGAVGKAGKIMDILTNDRNSKDTLIATFFDTSQDLYSDLKEQRYHHTMFGKLFGRFNPMFMYSRGEYWIHMLNTYSVLLHEKVLQKDPATGEFNKISLYEALEKGDKIEGNTELKVADNIYKLDGTKLDSMDDSYFTAIKRRMRYINQQCHGSMNSEDKGLVHQWMVGKAAMNFRQWMVEHYSRRYRTLHWDESIRDTDLSNFYNNTTVRLNGKRVKLINALEAVESPSGDSFDWTIKNGASTEDGKVLTDDILNEMLNKYAEDSGWRRGFWTDTAKLLSGYIKERRDYGIAAREYWDNLTETQRADVNRVMMESLLLLALGGMSIAMGDPDEHRGDFFFRLWMYNVRRCLMDEIASIPLGAAYEIPTIIRNPVASISTVNGLMYPLYGLFTGDFVQIDEDGRMYFPRMQGGRHPGMWRYGNYFLKYTLPFYDQIEQLVKIGEEDSAFQIFNNSMR